VPNIEDLGEVISTDVLVIGGGISGVSAAIKAREQHVNVLIVDKATVGWAGMATKAGNGLWVMGPQDDMDKFVEYQVKNIGCYLNDQELLYSLGRETYGAIEQLAEWGVKVTRNEKGEIGIFKHPVAPWSGTGVDLDIMGPLRANARKAGGKILNKVQVVELLRQDDRIVGAVGFNLIDSRFYILKAKATIVASAGCYYNVMRMFNGCGDGIAAAYRAGAEMRNAEFGNFYDVIKKDAGHSLYGAHSVVCNAARENISRKYSSESACDVSLPLFLGMEKEINEGRGPLYADMEEMKKVWQRIAPKFESEGILDGMVRLFPKKLAWEARAKAKEVKYGASNAPRPEVLMGLIGGFSPIKVDHEMRTSLVGLWAIGAASCSGSAWAGAVPPPNMMRGSGLMNALLLALRGGPSAALFAIEAAPPKVNYTEVKRLKEEIFRPMERDKGILPVDSILAIQEVICPVKYNLRRSKNRLEEVLSRIEEVQHMLPKLRAIDGHGLSRCHEARSMAICAEMTFRAALMRKESRGWHFREDYPKRDDDNWLKWIILKQEAGKMVLSTEPVPIHKYKVKP
jgi:succinate dehydrogenase / fumarate reductase flavoprotein subunit